MPLSICRSVRQSVRKKSLDHLYICRLNNQRLKKTYIFWNNISDPSAPSAAIKKIVRSISRTYLVQSVLFFLAIPILSAQKEIHMGLKHESREKKIAHGKFFDFLHKNVYRIRFQEIKIRPLKGFEKMRFLCFYIIGV